MFCSNWFCVFLSFLVKLNAANVLFASVLCMCIGVCVCLFIAITNQSALVRLLSFLPSFCTLLSMCV